MKEYQTAHHKRTCFMNKLRKQVSQPGFEFLRLNMLR